MRHRIRFLTWAIPGAETDLAVARELAHRFDLPHEVIGYLPPCPHDIDQWIYRSGGSVGEPRGMNFARAFRQMDPHTPYLPGLASEVGRAFYWRMGDEGRSALTASELVARLRLPLVNPLLDAAQRWLDDVPLKQPCDVLDVAYIAAARLLGQRRGLHA